MVYPARAGGRWLRTEPFQERILDSRARPEHEQEHGLTGQPLGVLAGGDSVASVPDGQRRGRAQGQFRSGRAGVRHRRGANPEGGVEPFPTRGHRA